MKKFVSWNVNGLRAVLGKGFLEEIERLDPDAIGLQETKLQDGQLSLELPGYYQYWNYALKKGYSGTALFVKEKPMNVFYGLGIEKHDQEGRVITLEYPDYYLITLYVPNSKEGLLRLDYRMQWEDDFLRYINRLQEKKPVIYCGDLNVAYQEIDLKNPSSNHNNPGFSDEEREKFGNILKDGYIDTFRYLYPDEIKYSWWSYRFNARKNNAGWRIDYFIVSASLKDKIVDAKIHNDILGSDHCPIELDIEI